MSLDVKNPINREKVYKIKEGTSIDDSYSLFEPIRGSKTIVKQIKLLNTIQVRDQDYLYLYIIFF